MARKVRIELILDAKGAVKGIRSIDGAVDDLDVSVKKTRKSLSTFKAALGAVFFAAAARGAARFAARMFELGSAVEETASKFNTVFGEMAGSVDEFGESFANMAGLTKREFRDVASVTGSILQGLGADLAASAVETERVLRLAADLASFNNVSIQEAFNAVRSGLIGESEPLRRFGIVLTEAKTKLQALNTTGKDSEKQLTELEKVQARLTLTIQGAGKAVGDQIRTQNSAANEAKKFNAVIKEQEELLATALLPALNDVRRAFSEVVVEEKKAVQDSITFLGRLTSIIVQMFGTALGGLNTFFGVANFKFQLALAQTERLVGDTLRRMATLALIVNNSLTAIGIGPVDAINRLAASTQKAAGFLDDVASERINMLLAGIGPAAESSVAGVDALVPSVETLSDVISGGDGGGGEKGLTGIVGSLNEEIRKLAFQVRDLTQADIAEVRALMAKTSELREELRLRRQLLGLAGAPVEGLVAAPVLGPTTIGSPEAERIELQGDVTDAIRDTTFAIQDQEAAEAALHATSIARAVALGAAQADILQGILASVRQIIQARLAEAIAGAVASRSILGPIAGAAAGALMAVLFNQLMPSGHKSSSGGAGAGAPVADTASSQAVALGGIRVQDRGFTAGATGAAAAARAQSLTIRVIEPNLFRLNTELSNADGVRAQVGSI